MASVYNGKAENQALWIQKNFKFIKNKHTEQSAFQSIMNYSWFNFLTNDSCTNPLVIISFRKEIMFWVCYLPTLWQIVMNYTVFCKLPLRTCFRQNMTERNSFWNKKSFLEEENDSVVICVTKKHTI